MKMEKIVRTILFLGMIINIGTAHAGETQSNKQLPSIVGPELYEIYTDARFFVTHVFVNGKALKLSNAEGNGSTRRGGYSFAGPMGYKNKLVLNGQLKAGKNEIKVVFEPSSIYADALRQGAEKIIRQDMFAHVVLVRGRLATGSLGVGSYDLDKLIESVQKSTEGKVKILKNSLIRRLSVNDLESEVGVVYQLDLLDTDKIFRADIDRCSLSKDGPTNISGTLFLNNGPIRKITGSSGRILSSIQKLMKPGDNVFHLKLDSISEVDANDRKIEKSYLKVSLECDLDTAIKKVDFPEEYSWVRYGDFFNKIYVPLVVLEFSKTGDYKAGFNINYDLK